MKYILPFFCIVIVLSVFGCTTNPVGKAIYNVEKSDNEAYSFAGPKNINMLPIIADRLGFFEKNGLSISRQDIQTGKITMDALINGDIDFGILVETNIAFIKFQGDPEIEVIAIIEEKTDDAIIADKKITSPEDFIGKQIGVTKGTTSHAFAVSFLKYHGIDLSDVELVNMPQPSIQASIINGNLKAGSLWQPFRYNIEKEKDVQTFNDKEAYKAYAVVAVKKNFAKQNSLIIEKFLKSLVDAETYYIESPDSVRLIVSEELNIPLEVLNVIWGEYHLEVSLKKELLDTIKEEGQWISEIELVGKPIPEYEDSINTEYLEKIDAKRVQWE